MIMMEFREEVYDKILDKGKKAKRAICELVETLYNCDETEYDDEYSDEYVDDPEISYRSRSGYRSNMRMRSRMGNRRAGRYAY